MHDAVAEVIPPRLRDALTRRVSFILIIALVSNTTLYMVQPFLAVYFNESRGFSMAQSGILLSLSYVPAILFGTVGGYWADRLGVLRTYILATAVYGLSVASIGFFHSFSFLAILVLISGLAVSFTQSGIAALLNVTAKAEHRGLLQNYLYWLNNLGIVGGLLVSSELLHAGASNIPLILVGSIRILMSLAILLVIPISKAQHNVVAQSSPARTSMMSTFKILARDRPLVLTACSVLLLMIVESQLDGTMPLYFKDHFSHGVSLFGPMVAINSVVLVTFQPLAVKLVQKRKRAPVFAVGAISFGIGLSFGGVVGSVWSWIAGMILFSIGESLWSSKFHDLVGELPSNGNETVYFGAIRSSLNVAFFIGTSVGPIIWQTVGSVMLFGSMTVLAAMSIPLYYRATRIHERRGGEVY